MGIERSTGSTPEPGVGQNVPEKPGTFYGYDVTGMSPTSQIAMGFGILLPTVIAFATFGFALTIAPAKEIAPLLTWLTFLFLASLGWMIPAAALVVRGVKELSGSSGSRSPVSGTRAFRAALETSGAGERAVLKALRENGEMSAARAAAEASITAAEADEILSRLAGEGHLRLRIRGVGLFYSLWETRVEDGGSGEFGAL